MRVTPYTVWWAPHGAAVVSMPARIDRANCARVHAALMRAVRSGAAVIVADLTSTHFCGAGKLARGLSVARRARHAPPPRPPTDPA